MENGKQPIVPFLSNEGTPYDSNHLGLTKREYFAGLAMQGLMPIWSSNNPSHISECVKRSIMFADELLKQLEKPQE